MKKYIIRFDSTKVLSVMPVFESSEILGTPQMLITSLEWAKIMLTALGCDTAQLDTFQEPEAIEE